MLATDYSPPSFPTAEEQHDALCKGLGRALQWAMSGKLRADLLLQACLCDLRFDCLVDESRGDWLWSLVEAMGAVDHFRAPILGAFSDWSGGGPCLQMCELACHYAARGDHAFRTALYDLVQAKPVADCPWYGEEEIIRLDGERGILFALRQRGMVEPVPDWDWHDDSIMELACERLGSERIDSLLTDTSDVAIQRYLQRWRGEQARKASQVPQAKSTKSVDDVIAAAHSTDKCNGLQFWGAGCKDESQLNKVFEYLCAADQPEVMDKLLRVFWRRALPQFDPRLLELCLHPNAEVARSALFALAENQHPKVREFAVAKLAGGISDGAVVELFTKNYVVGDAERILQALILPADQEELHMLLMKTRDMLQENAHDPHPHLAILTYRLTPCGFCRFCTVRTIHGQRIAPEWVVDECQHDANEETRTLVCQTD